MIYFLAFIGGLTLIILFEWLVMFIVIELQKERERKPKRPFKDP